MHTSIINVIISTKYKKHGVSFDDFIEDNKDWRSFGSITYEGMKENGYVDILLKKIYIYKSAKTNKARHKAVLCSSELPPSEVASRLLDTKMRILVEAGHLSLFNRWS